MDTVRGVDFERREVLVDGDAPLHYDYLVLAAGAVSSDFGVPGAAEHAIPLKTLADATQIRSTVLSRFEEADADPSLRRRRHPDVRGRRRRSHRRRALRSPG